MDQYLWLSKRDRNGIFAPIDDRNFKSKIFTDISCLLNSLSSKYWQEIAKMNGDNFLRYYYPYFFMRENRCFTSYQRSANIVKGYQMAAYSRI